MPLKTVLLGDIVEFQRGFDLPIEKMSGGTIPVIGSNGIIGYHNEYTTKGPVITIGRSGNIGNPRILYGDAWCHNTTLFIKKYNGCDPQFIYYFLKTFDFKNYAGGSAVPTLNRNHIQNVEITIPSEIDIQIKIGKMLRTLDEKIELNQTINDNLSKECQTILHHYYDAYDSVESSVGENAEVIDCLHSKKPELQKSGMRFIQLDNIKDNGLLDFSNPFWISEQDYSHWISRCEVSEGDVVITNVGRIGAVSQMPKGEKAAMGRNMTCIRPLKYPAFMITALLSDEMRSEIDYNTDSGTIMGALNVRNIPKLRLRVFEETVQSDLEIQLKTIRSNMELILKENQKLIELRDYLLPKLMSGEIDVSNLPLPS